MPGLALKMAELAVSAFAFEVFDAFTAKHVHKALRRYLGIANTPGAQRFPFNNTEDFAFFG